MFVDADDALAAGWWDAVRPHLEGGEDIVCFLAGAERERYTPDELVRATIGDPGAPPLAWPAPPWAKLYRADLLAARGARFAPDIMYGEDALFNLGLYASGARCRFVAASVYRYRLRPGSTTRSYDERFVESNERYLRALEKILIDCGRYPRPGPSLSPPGRRRPHLLSAAGSPRRPCRLRPPPLHLFSRVGWARPARSTPALEGAR